MVAVGEDLGLEREEGAARVDEVDARQVVLLRDLLRAQVLLHGQREVGAALHGRVVRDDHALLALDDADARDDPGRGGGAVVQIPGGERVQLEERRAGIDEPVDPLAGRQLPARAVALDRLLAAAARHRRRALAQFGDERLHPLGAAREGLVALDLRGEKRHGASLTNPQPVPGFVQRDTLRPMLVAAGAVAIVPPALIHFMSPGHVLLSSKTHFWSVVLSALVATAAGVALSFGGWRGGDARAVLVGTAFTVMASLLVVHGLASPGFIVEMNGVVSLTGAATLPVGAVILALSAWPGANRPRAVQPLLWLQGALMVPVAADLFRSAPSRPLAGDLSGAELVSAEEAFLGSQVGGLMRLLAEKDAYTEGHTRRVALLAVTVGEQLGLAPARLRELATGGLLHDIGKLSVPDDVLQKPAALNEAEYALVQRHTVWGDTLLGHLGFSPRVRLLVRGHHERLDGSGYLDGTSSLSLETRVLAVCDVYDALRSQRVYRPAWSHERALGLLREEAGTAFDARCVRALEHVLERAGASDADRDRRLVLLRPVDRVGILQSGDKRAALFAPRTGAPMMIRYTIMSRLGLAEPLVRLVRAIEKSNRSAASRPSARTSPPPRRARGRASRLTDLPRAPGPQLHRLALSG